MSARPVLVLATVIAALAGCSAPANETDPASSSTTTQTSNPNHVECVNIERAYNAWVWKPSSSVDFTEAEVRRWMEDGDNFATAVEGYKDQPSLRLSAAIAEYNYELSLANFALVSRGAVPEERVSGVLAVLGRVNAAYDAFKRRTCPT